jgi:hypothetical protein
MSITFFTLGTLETGDRSSTVVEVLHYKSEDGVMEFLIDINPSDRTMDLGWTQPLTEMSTRGISWG